MKKIFALFLLGTLTLLVAGCGKSAPTTDTTLPTDTVDTTTPTVTDNIYENKDAKFSVKIPDGWQFEENAYSSLVMFYTPQVEGDEFRENVGVMTEQLPYDVTLEEYYEAAKANLQTIVEGYTEITKEKVTINGLEGIKLIYKGKTTGYDLQWEQVYFIKGKTTYILTYTSGPDTFATYIKDVDTIVNSFTLK